MTCPSPCESEVDLSVGGRCSLTVTRARASVWSCLLDRSYGQWVGRVSTQTRREVISERISAICMVQAEI